MNKYTLTQLSSKSGEIVQDALVSGSVILTKAGKPVALIVRTGPDAFICRSCEEDPDQDPCISPLDKGPAKYFDEDGKPLCDACGECREMDEDFAADQ